MYRKNTTTPGGVFVLTGKQALPHLIDTSALKC